MANNWAIVVGIDSYKFLPTAPLKFAVADALAMRSFLCDEAGFKAQQVLVCVDGDQGTNDTTKPTLRDILLHRLERAKDADNLWFFFSGHGISEHLMTFDGNPRDLKETAISIEFVTKCLRDCNAKNIVLVLDMCRSESRDSGQRSADSIEASLRELVKQREGQQGIITLFSCGRGESSYEIAELGQGAFTYALLEGLRRTTIVSDLARHLEKRVPELHQIHASEKRRKQVPLVIPEPDWKCHEPILSCHATEADVARLKEMAIDAECDDDLPTALRLWEQINLLAEDVKDRQRAMNKIKQLSSNQRGNGSFVLLHDAFESPIELPVIEEQTSSPITSESQPQYPIDAIALDSEKSVDYRNLRDLLKAGQWREADQETLQVMLKAANRVSDGWLDTASLKQFPCKDLKTIDQLWVTASNGHFGFSVQKKIWEDCGSPTGSENWDRFCVRVGWQNKQATAYVNYSDLSFNPSLSPKGELPGGVLRWRGWVKGVRRRGGVGVGGLSSLAQRLVNCEIRYLAPALGLAP